MVNYGIRYVFYIMYFLSIDNYEYSKKKTTLVVASLAIICGSINQNIFTRLLEYYMIGIYIAIVKSKYLMTAGRSRNLYLLILYVVFMIILARNLLTVSSGTYMNYQLYPFK
ncbi:EpsG family protein [Ligilactobacillus salivarius]|uniref:EpsG family protein n=1 Tax=Ligilactobacillus salivarius TaxID=1624 RepID=UPI00226C4FAC|nr:EpsG family protein [Ligilactobacillus salivarius]